MKNKKILILALVLLIVIVALVGCKPKDGSGNKDKNIGVYAIYDIDTDKLTQEQKEDIDSVIESARVKLEEFIFNSGYSEAKVTLVNQRIRVEILDKDNEYSDIYNLFFFATC